VTYVLSEIIDRASDGESSRAAFRCQSDEITYQELVSRCNQLGNLLLEQGVRRGDRVGIFLPRCLETAIAVFGILKAGAAFVPIDPLTPLARLRQIVADCDIRHLITNSKQRKSVEGLVQEQTTLACVLGIENIETPVRMLSWESLSQYAERPPAVQIHEHDLAYIMYTSGSTGCPKGIMHTHFSGISYAELSAATYSVRPQDCIGNHSPLHFDMSTFGYFTGPFAGATTVIIPAAYTKLPASLSELMQSEQMTIWYSVPYALIQLLLRGVLDQRDLSSLRWVLFGGEPFPVKHLRALMSAWPQARFSNVYGPAEVNQCTYYHVPSHWNTDGSEDQAQIPIGKTWDRTEGLVLADDDKPIEIGVTGEDATGELVICSPTMMRGYWARPDLDATAFYRRQADGNLSDVFYRTGDIVRVETDGNYTFLGRKDRQIKIRGYRVEIDDIEAALAAHPAVEEVGAYPIVREGVVIEIAAALLLRAASRATTTEEDLTAFASKLLPVYAVPTRISFVDRLPRTTSGKIDRLQLQELDQQTRIAKISHHES